MKYVLKRHVSVLAAVSLVALLVLPSYAQALDKLVVGRASIALLFVPLEIGNKAGIWAKNGLDLQIVTLAGGAQLQQAFTAKSIEVGLGSGTSLAFVSKGVPIKSIAAFAGPPNSFVVVVPANSPIKSVADLRGKTMGFTQAGALEDWLVRELSRSQGWNPQDGIKGIALGATRTRLAAMKIGELDSMTTTAEQGYELEAAGEGRIIVNFGHVVKHFITHAFYARNETIAERPDVLRRFLTGWWETIDYMRANRDITVDIAAAVMKLNKASMAKSYDGAMEMALPDGAFDPAALNVLSRSFVELGILEKEPDMASLYTTQFLPVRK